MKISKRGNITPFQVMEFFREANEFSATGGDVVHLSIGQPGRGAPELAVKAAHKLLDASKLGYTDAIGITQLRRKLVEHYDRLYRVSVPPERIFSTIGSSAAFFISVMIAFDQGDRVGIVEPCYPAYRNMLETLGIEVVLLRGTPENRFQPTLEMLKKLDKKLDGLVVASPSNPSGTMLSGDELHRITQYCDANAIRIISDEIYHGITYGQKAHSILEYSHKHIVVNSFSKYFLMPGWRLGWAVVPEELCRSFESALQNFFVSPPTLAQFMAVEALDSLDELNAVVQDYARNREILLKELPEAGFTNLCPADGAFYIYANVASLTNDSTEFCRRMMREAGVVATPGGDFDKELGNQFVRFSFSVSEEDVRESVRRLKKWLGKEGKAKPGAKPAANIG